jgi:Flp pilus assembly protein TadD
MNRPRLVRRVLRVLALAAAGATLGCSHFVVLHDALSASEHNDLGVAYESSGEPALAAGEYRKALRLEPRMTRARVNLGNIEAANGHWSVAERCYRRALGDAPADPDAMNNLAYALFRQGRRLDEARMLAERAVAAGGERDSVYRATLASIKQGSREAP